jgi:hypothetical protein
MPTYRSTSAFQLKASQKARRQAQQSLKRFQLNSPQGPEARAGDAGGGLSKSANPQGRLGGAMMVFPGGRPPHHTSRGHLKCRT